MDSLTNNYFITGIGTDVGKTVISAILVKALNADYWKPIQSGTDSDYDRLTVKNLLGNFTFTTHPESYALSKPLSPHAAAKIDGVNIELEKIKLPKTNNNLVIEGAGGLLVPINQTQTVADLILHLNCKVIVVSKNYLGSINHTLLTIEALKQRNIQIHGIIFNGESTPESQNIIESMTGCKILSRVPEAKLITPEFINQQALAINLS